MHDEEMKQRVQKVIASSLSGVQTDPWLAQRVLTAGQATSTRRRGRGKTIVAVGLLLCLALTATVGIAWSISRQYFTEVARLTVTSGDYADWSPDEKRCMVQIMGEYGLIPEGEARWLVRQEEAAIDAFMLERYGAHSAPDDLGFISINRIAWVELGDSTYWSNETWIWFTEMMLETGLWEQNGNMDLFVTPGEEAVPPESAIAQARQCLMAAGRPSEQLDGAQIIWHYYTDGADPNRTRLRYGITFLYKDQAEDHVILLPDGTVESFW